MAFSCEGSGGSKVTRPNRGHVKSSGKGDISFWIFFIIFFCYCLLTLSPTEMIEKILIIDSISETSGSHGNILMDD